MKSLSIVAVRSFMLVMMFVLNACGRQQEAAPAKEGEPANEESGISVIAELFGNELVTADKSKATLEVLNGKTVGIYFSAHWCPPCRRFTPVLVKVYNELKEAGKDFELVFVSSDSNEKAMYDYMEETKMPWYALPYGTEKKESLSKLYGVRGIPSLVIIDKDGKTVTKNGRGDVSGKGADAFSVWQK